MAEEKVRETVTLKNKDVRVFYTDYGGAAIFGIYQVSGNQVILVDKDSQMTAYVHQEMKANQRNLLAASVGKIIKVTKNIEIDDGLRKATVIQQFEIKDQIFTQQDHYEVINHKQLSFAPVVDQYNLPGDIDNIKFGSSIIRVRFLLYNFCITQTMIVYGRKIAN